MNRNSIVAFILGAAVGSVITWKLIETKYEQIAKEEIDSYREIKEANREEKDDSERKIATVITTDKVKDESMSEYLKKADNYNTTTEEETEMDKPYVIHPDDVGELEDYDVVTLTHYADGVLADDLDDEMIEDVDDLVGADYAEHFGEYEEDSVFIRNEKYQTDYEICRDNRNYSDVHADDV